MACPHCGASNPPGSALCAYCQQALPEVRSSGLGVPASYPDTFSLVTGRSPDGSTSLTGGGRAVGYYLIYLGIGVLLLGIALLVISSVVASNTSSFNQACSKNPVCQPAPDSSGGIAIAGVIALIGGVFGLGLGVSRLQPSQS